MVWLRRILLASIFLAVASARAWTVRQYSTAVPVWDQWDAEALLTLIPWREGKLTFDAFLAPHNEHRVALTRLTAFLLYLVNGQWDPEVEMMATAIMYGLLAAWFAWALFAIIPDRMHWLLVVALLLAFCLPFGWGNTLGGFQSAFYFFIGTTLVALWGLTTGRKFSARWWAGAISMTLTLGSLGSGLLTPACLFAVLLVRALLRQKKVALWSELPTVLLCLAVAMIGWFIRVAPPLTFRWSQGESAGAFFRALLGNLAWPLPLWPWIALVFWLPYGLLAKTMIFDVEKREDNERLFLISVGSWVILQALSIAIYRPYPQPASRYLDVLVVGTICNLTCWILLLSTDRLRALVIGGMALWGSLALIGIGRITRENFLIELPERARIHRALELDTRAFLATGDLKVFDGKAIADLPYPQPKHMADIIARAGMGQVLPPIVRDVEQIEVEESEGFVPDGVGETVPIERGRPSWGSYTGARPAGVRRFVSKPFESPPAPFLRFEVSGYLGEPSTSLMLVDRDGHEHPIKPSQLAREAWKTVDIRLRGVGPFRLLARDESATHWFAFRGPYAVGPLSHYAKIFMSLSGLIFSLGLSGATLSLFLTRAKLTGQRSSF